MKNIKLKTMLFKMGLNQRELAKRAGIHETILSLAINGRYILTEKQKTKIADALGKPVSILF